MAVEIRTAQPDDITACGRIIYQAFKGIAEWHNFPHGFLNEKEAEKSASAMLEGPGFEAAVAEERGAIVGSIFFSRRSQVGGISVITVDPNAQDRTVGRQLMQHGMRQLEEHGHVRQQLVQAAYHNRSLCLYAKLGFIASDILSYMTGAPFKADLQGRTVRPANESDADTCNELCRKVHGFDRPVEVQIAIAQGTAAVVESAARITGYTSGVGFLGHGVGESNDDLKALIASVDKFMGPGLLIPTTNGELFRWCLDNGLKVVQQMILMDTEPSGPPKGVYWPAARC